MSNENGSCGHHDNSNLKTCNGCSCHEKETPLTKETVNDTSGKSATCNNWSSVPKNYDIKEPFEKHEKTATNNQWCSCSK
ncbi:MULTISPECIES: hypothetical protein [Clostridium]|uniref:Uncharacterized protein n=1 Tax=Clostridium aquiflavi TaxID=3073603 RepID=A0ABU1EHH8_9CLOT|nr:MULTISPECIES: hypothetical protein [unclassified Clostridium]MDR5587854.1 hypothetical protein [Clostridium sp. 5N-1]NFG61403.1 hypothetical protein [Clostridium botulinum]NFQ10385.1 hypothetical protein [Clostridium botulinum]